MNDTSTRWLKYGMLFLPALLFLSLYLPSIDHGFVWMDQAEIEQGNIILPQASYGSAFTRPLHITRGYNVSSSGNPYYRPFQLLLVSTIYHSAGPVPRYFRAAAYLTGAACITLFAVFVLMLTGQHYKALFAASIVAVHPVGIEAFVWISGISEAMSGLLVITSLILILAYLRSRSTMKAVTCGLLSVLVLIAALLSKEKSVVLPLLLFAMLVSLYMKNQVDSERNDNPEPDIILNSGLILLSAFLTVVFIYLFVLRPAVLGASIISHPSLGGSIESQLLTAVSLWPQTIGWLFLPIESSTSDVVRVVTSPGDILVWAGAGLAAGSLLLWVFLLRTGRTIAALGLAWIWIAYLPTADIIPMLHARADRYLFLSVFGAALLVVSLLPEFAKLLVPGIRKFASAGTIFILIALLGQRTWARLPDWETTMTLFEKDVAGAPHFREGRLHLATNLMQQGQFHRANRHIERLINDIENFPGLSSNINVAGAYQVACFNYMAMHRYQQAEKVVRKAIAREPVLAHHPAVLDCLAQAVEADGRYQDALDILLFITGQLTAAPPQGISLAIARNYARLGYPVEAREWLGRVGTGKSLNPGLRKDIGKVRALIKSAEQ